LLNFGTLKGALFDSAIVRRFCCYLVASLGQAQSLDRTISRWFLLTWLIFNPLAQL
jgi:hypothetical protein